MTTPESDPTKTSPLQDSPDSKPSSQLHAAPNVTTTNVWEVSETPVTFPPTRASQPEHASASLPIGRLGKFSLIRELGRGGMGVVYEAIQEDVGRRVALKVPDRVSDAERIRFEWEARILAQFQDPAIATLYEHGVAKDDSGTDRPYFAMEFVDGQSLNLYVTQKSLSAREKVQLVAKVAEAAGRAHRRGIVHRDLKPANILVDKSGSPKILDFGVAKFTEGRPDELQTLHGQVIGTIAYMSPEQAEGKSDQAEGKSDQASHPCDVYALGTILYELLTDRPPINLKGLPILKALEAIRTEVPLRIGKLNRELSGDLEVIVAKSLEKEPDIRFSSASEFAAELNRWLNNEPITSRPLTFTYQLRKLIQRNKTLSAAVGFILIIGLFSLIVITQSWSNERVARNEADQREKEATKAKLIAESARKRELEESIARYQQRGDWKNVLAAIEAYEKNYGNENIAFSLDRAMSFFVLGRYDDCEKVLSRWKEGDAALGVHQARHYLLLGLLANTLKGDIPNAKRLTAKAVELPGLSPGDQCFAKAFVASNRVEAEKLLREGIAQEPFNYLCLSNLTAILTLFGEVRDAEALVAVGERLFPEDPSFVENRIIVLMRRNVPIDFDELKEELKQKMDPAQVDRMIAFMRTNIKTLNAIDGLFEAMFDGDKSKAQKAQRDMLPLLASLLNANSGRRSSLNASMPALDWGILDIAKRIPLVLIGLGKENLYQTCKNGFYSSRDPLAACFACILAIPSESALRALPENRLLELGELATLAANTPSVMKRLPVTFNLVRIRLYVELAKRAEDKGAIAKALEYRKFAGESGRFVINSEFSTPKIRGDALVIFGFGGGSPSEVRSLADTILANTPDNTDALTMLALAETLLGNIDRAELLMGTLSALPSKSSNLTDLRTGILSRIQNAKTNRLEAAKQELNSTRLPAALEILELSRAYDRIGRSIDAELAARGALAVSEKRLEELQGQADNGSLRSEVYRHMSIAHWRLGDFDKACDDVLASIAAAPSDHWPVFVGAPKLLLAGRLDDYNRVIRDSLERFGQSEDPTLCERIAKVAMLNPNAEIMPVAAALAYRSRDIGKDHQYKHYFQLVAAMADVRLKKYDAEKGVKGRPFYANFDHANFLRLTSVLLHAIGSKNTSVEGVSRQYLLEVAPYFANLDLRIAAHDHDLLTQVALYREAAAAYQLADVLAQLKNADWKLPLELKATDSRERTLSSPELGIVKGDPQDPADVYFIESKFAAPIQAIRIEALTDSNLPKNGPGTDLSNGRCHITEIRVSVIRNGELEPVKISWGIPGSFEPPQGMISQAFDNVIGADWGPNHDDRLGQPLDGIFVFDKPVTLAEGEQLRIEVQSRLAFGVPVKLRVRATNEPLTLP